MRRLTRSNIPVGTCISNQREKAMFKKFILGRKKSSDRQVTDGKKKDSNQIDSMIWASMRATALVGDESDSRYRR